jgi:hypothetical protein
MSNENEGDRLLLPPVRILDGRAVLGWATVRTGLTLFVVGTIFVFLGGLFLSFQLWRENRRPDDLTPAMLALLLLGPGLILAATGAGLSWKVPKGAGVRERVWAFLCGLGMVAGLVAALASTLIDRSRAQSWLHERDNSVTQKLRERQRRAEEAFTRVRNTLVVVGVVTELLYFLLLRGMIASVRGRPLGPTAFRCLLLAFVLLVGALALAWWKPEVGLPDPSDWDVDYVRCGMAASGLLALLLVLVAGRTHQIITEVLLRR